MSARDREEVPRDRTGGVGSNLLLWHYSAEFSDSIRITVAGKTPESTLKVVNRSQVVVVHGFNPSTWEADTGGSL